MPQIFRLLLCAHARIPSQLRNPLTLALGPVGVGLQALLESAGNLVVPQVLSGLSGTGPVSDFMKTPDDIGIYGLSSGLLDT